MDPQNQESTIILNNNNVSNINFPKTLLNPTNYRNYMSKQQYQGKLDGSLILNTNDVNTSIQHSMFQNQFSKQQYQQYHNTARNLRTVCDHDFSSGNTKFHDKQKFGLRQQSKKLKPMSQQNEFLKNCANQLKRKPRRQKQNIDQRTYLRKIIKKNNQPMITQINGFSVELKSENAEQAGLDQGTVTSCFLNFSDSHFLNQHNLHKIVEFFQDYILLDEEYLSFEFDKFQQQPALKSQLEDDQNIQQFPKYLEKSLETEDDTKQIIMHFPNIQVDFPSINYKQSYYLSQQQFQNMLISNFENLDQIVQNFLNEDELYIIKNDNKTFNNITYKPGDIFQDMKVQFINGLDQTVSNICFANLMDSESEKQVLLAFVNSIYDAQQNYQILEKFQNFTEQLQHLFRKRIELILLTSDDNDIIKNIFEKYEQYNQEKLQFNVISDPFRNISSLLFSHIDLSIETGIALINTNNLRNLEDDTIQEILKI